MKLSQKENPLDIPVYKLPGTDGRGAWFARRSVHEGFGFDRWKAKQAGEFEETLRVNRMKVEKGKLPDYSVRGIGADRVVEEVEVRGDGDDGGDVVANVKVYHVTATFPRPTTWRDFSPLIVTRENMGEDAVGGTGRNWMVVSIPCEHPDVPSEDGYIRGQYESVEFIREIPRHGQLSDSKSDSNLLGKSAAPSGKGAKGRKRGETDPAVHDTHKEVEEGKDQGSNPVEWIMVTRSDPGGSIPRWMVEKGTPKSICADTVKFLDWACRDDEMSEAGSDGTAREPPSPSEAAESSDGSLSEGEGWATEVERSGLIASVTSLVNAGLGRFAPQTVLDYFPYQLDGDSESTPGKKARAQSDTSQITKNTGGEAQLSLSQERHSMDDSANSGFETPVEHGDEPFEVMQKNKGGKLSSHEKQLVKLAQRRRKIEAKLEAVRSEIQCLPPSHTSNAKPDKKEKKASQPDSEKTSSSRGSTSSKKSETRSSASQAESKANVEAATSHKAASSLYRTESKLLKQLEKIEKNQLKVAGKIQARQRKEIQREEKARSRSEVDGLRREVDKLKKEVGELKDERQKALDLVKSLQAENERLATKDSNK